GQADTKETAKKARDRLQGTWDVVAMEHDGERTANKEVKDLQMIFTGKKMTLNKGDKASFDSLYKVDPTKNPKTIDIKFLMGPDEGKTFKGIYTLKGDRLVICWSESGTKRPTSLTTKPKSSRTLYILKRAKAE